MQMRWDDINFSSTFLLCRRFVAFYYVIIDMNVSSVWLLYSFIAFWLPVYLSPLLIHYITIFTIQINFIFNVKKGMKCRRKRNCFMYGFEYDFNRKRKKCNLTFDNISCGTIKIYRLDIPYLKLFLKVLHSFWPPNQKKHNFILIQTYKMVI